MKKLTAILCCLLLALAATHASLATTLRVNNTGITGTNIYTDLPAAYTAAAVGDVIQVEPSGTQYSGITVAKNVTIVGPGYFLDPSQNANLQANPLPATVGSIVIAAGGGGAYIAGLTVGTYYVNTSSVTVQRCNINVLYLNNTSAQLSNVNVIQNYIYTLTYYTSSYGIDNMYIANNIITNYLSLSTLYNGGFFNNVVSNGTGGSSANLSNFYVTNNYFQGSSGLTGKGNTLSYNITADNYIGTANGNQVSVAAALVFTLSPGTTVFDAWFQLKSGTNPARGTGQSGADIGAFGGTAPYKLGGLPNIPAIYQQTQTITGNSLSVTLSTRSNN